VLKHGIEAKSKEFVGKGPELCAKVQRSTNIPVRLLQTTAQWRTEMFALLTATFSRTRCKAVTRKSTVDTLTA
jgi:hypothetical protein